MVVVDPNIVARTERLLIRPLTLKDAADILLMRKDPEVMKHTSILPSDDLQKTRDWIQGCHERDNNWNFVIELLPTSTDDPPAVSAESKADLLAAANDIKSPRVIGILGAVRAPEVGYMLNASYWGRGYATEALRGFMPLFFDHFSGGEHERYEYAVALTDPELVSSQKVLSKVGFRLHEKRENDFDNPVLGLRDTLEYRMSRPELADSVS